jgi:hypothetical protein
VTAGETTWRTRRAVLNGKKRRRLLESKRRSTPERAPPQAAPKAQRAGPSAEQMDLGEGWNHVVRGGVWSRPPQLQSQIPLLSRSRRRPSSLKWPLPGRRPGLRSRSANLQQALSCCWEAKEESSRECQNSGCQTHYTDLVVPIPPPHSTKLPISIAFPSKHMELIRRLLTSISLPTGAASPRALLKTVILFVAEYGSTP